MENTEKKPRKFLKMLGKVGEIVVQEALLKILRGVISRIGGKKTLPSILFLLLSLSLFAQYPATGNKQRLGYQTTADGLVWRGSLSDTSAIQPLSNQNAWVILDTINLKIYSFDFTSNVWNQLPSGTTIDTTSLSNRINLKVNISDTAAMLLPYASKTYVDTAGRFYARQDFTNVSSSTLTWTQSDTLVVNGTGVVQVYRNGQILLHSQYTIPTNASVVIGATAYKLGENYTVIFPKGGGGSGGSGSGSLTSISGGTGITVSPNPITTTGTVSADLTVLMELTDTVTLSNRINNKVNISDTASMLLPYFRDADTISLNLTTRFALKLNAADTASLSSRINTKGTVSSVATSFGLLGGTITTTGTLLLDSAVVFSQIRDSIVDVAIGSDTIKILKQEYSPATTSVLTWTITPKFPIQLKAYILVFRNGQLLNNDQFNLTDTNKITIVSTSFKVGANYTVATVSGIGSVGSAQAGNPIYPEAGIALSTGTTWASSIPNNSSNWNIAFNDKINNAVFSGTDTKTLTLSQYDGGTFAPTFTDLQGVTQVTGGTGLIGGTITTTGTLAADTNFLVTRFDTSAMLMPYLKKLDTTSMLLPYFKDADTSSLNLTSRFALKLNSADTVSLSNRINNKVNISDTATMLLPYFRDADTSSLNLTSRFALKLNSADTVSLSSRINGKVSLNGTETINGSKSFNNVVNILNQMTLSGSVEGLNKILGKNTDGNGVGDITIGTGLSLTSNTLNATQIDTASMLSPYWRSGRFSGTLPIVNGGTGATSESNARTNLKVDYVFIATNAGAGVAVTTNRVFIVNSGGSLTTTLDLTTSLTSGNTYMIKNLASGTIISSAFNVIALNGGSASTPILSAGNVTPQWCTLVCDGTNWHIIQRN